MDTINLAKGKKVYFASDFHLGAPNFEKSRIRELNIIRWLEHIKKDAQVLFLVGDLFDFWFEYKNSIPKGYTRFFGKLAELSDFGIEIIVFSGNHDMWMGDYLSTEIGLKQYREPRTYKINNTSFYVGHGDGLGPGDYAYKILKRVFESRISRFLFTWVFHPNIALFLGNSWASHSWAKHEKEDDVYFFVNKEKEILYSYAKEIESKQHHDYYIFGHRHYKLDIEINANSKYLNLGDWIVFNSYGVFDGNSCTIEIFD